MERGDLIVILQACADGRDSLHLVHLDPSTQLIIHERTIGGTVRLEVKSSDTVKTPSRQSIIARIFRAHAAHILPSA